MQKTRIRAADFNDAAWINHSPLTLADLRGKIVLLDFWTFCCINCQRVLPDLAALEREFGDDLVVIGIHSAKFDHEKSERSIKDAIVRHRIGHLVINDHDFKIWNAYAVRAWPTLVLIDPEGYEVARFSGEGHLDDLRGQIAALIGQHSKALRHDRPFLPLPAAAGEGVLRFPGKIHAANNRLYIANSGRNEVLVCEPDGKIVHVIGNLSDPQGLWLENETLFIANAGSGEVVTAQNHLLEKRALLSNIRSPWDVVVREGVLYIAVAGSHAIFGFNIAEQRPFRVAGSGHEDLVDAPAKEAALAQTSGLSFYGDTLYFVDSETSALRHLENGRVVTDAGTGLFDFGDRDGDAAQALMQHPLGVACGAMDGGCGGFRVFVADTYNGKIKAFDPEGKTLTTVADGFSEPGGLALSGCILYVADTAAHRIVALNLKTFEQTAVNVRYEGTPTRCYENYCEGTFDEV